MKSLFLILSILMFFPAAAQAEERGGCVPLKKHKTEVNINLLLPDAVYRRDLSLREINKTGAQARKEWIEENGMKELWTADDMTTMGYASGGWGVVFDMSLSADNFDSYGAYYCTFFNKLNIEMMYRTLIFIPKELETGSCGYNVINEHELMHHEANRRAVEMYVEKLRQDLTVMINEIETPYRPYVSKEEIVKHFGEMQQGIKDAVEIYFFESMYNKAVELNRNIDTPQEYEARSILLDACFGKPAPTALQ